jgi:hypothetical protein
MTPARARYAGYRFPCEIISHAVWLYFRFPLRVSVHTLRHTFSAHKADKHMSIATLQALVGRRRRRRHSHIFIWRGRTCGKRWSTRHCKLGYQCATVWQKGPLRRAGLALQVFLVLSGSGKRKADANNV